MVEHQQKKVADSGYTQQYLRQPIPLRSPVIRRFLWKFSLICPGELQLQHDQSALEGHA